MTSDYLSTARACVAALAIALAGCAAVPVAAPEDNAPLAWPPAPEQPRVAFVQSLSRAEDLGITRSLFGRLSDLLFGAADSRIVRPMAVVAWKGAIFVADPGARGVHRFEPAAGRYDLIRLPGGAPMPSPVGLALGPSGDVYVTDSVLGQVLRVTAGKAEAAPLPLEGGLRQPTGIAVDAPGARLLVVDTAVHAVRMYTFDGKLLGSFGKRGAGDGEFNFPTHLWRLPDGRLLVTDSLNFRVQQLAADGQALGKFGKLGDGTGDAARQKGVASDRFGHVYVVDSLFSALQVFDLNGRFLLSIGALGQRRGEFWLPTGIFIDERDMIYVADSYNQRVQMLRYVGAEE